jgi:hypothetical protein
MTDHLKTILSHQFEASLCMLNDCVQMCPAHLWETPVARYPFWLVAYHTLCFVDLYLSPGEQAFQYHPVFHPKGGAEFDDEYPSRSFTQGELTTYLQLVRQKALDAFASETAESLQGPANFPRRNFTRAELHVYNLRHLQHHTGQLSAHLRRHDSAIDPRWIGSGWK